MSRITNQYADPRARVKSAAKKLGIPVIDHDRMELCRAGFELCVLKENDVTFILKDALTIADASRRLKTCIKNNM